LIYFYKNNSEEYFKILAKIRDTIMAVSYCSPETLILMQILTGLFYEDKKDQNPGEAEKCYLIGLLHIF
jgi:hypothetical protein